ASDDPFLLRVGSRRSPWNGAKWGRLSAVMQSRRAVSLWLPITLAALGGCSASGTEPLAAAAGAAPGTGGANSSVGTGGIEFDSGVPDASGYGCSGDLQSVIDGNGTVVMTCPSDQG